MPYHHHHRRRHHHNPQPNYDRHDYILSLNPQLQTC